MGIFVSPSAASLCPLLVSDYVVYGAVVVVYLGKKNGSGRQERDESEVEECLADCLRAWRRKREEGRERETEAEPC